MAPTIAVVPKSLDTASEAMLRSLLQQAHTLLLKLGNVQGAIHTFQLVLTYIRAAGSSFPCDLILEVLKFLKPLTRALDSQPLAAVTLLEQANGIAERFGFVEYQIKFSLQMPLILLPEMDLQSDDTMKQLRRAVQECAGAHLLVTKYLIRLQSPSHTSHRTDTTLTSKIEKLSVKLNALLSTVEKMFLLYTASHISFHPHILQTLDAETIFQHYACLEKLANHFLKRSDYERARALFPSKLQSPLIMHNFIYGYSLLKIHSDINTLECVINGIAPPAAPTELPSPVRREGRPDSTVMMDILNELEQEQWDQSNEYPKTVATAASVAPTIGSPKSQALHKALKTDNFEQALFMQFRRSFAALRKQVPATLLVSDDQGNLDTNLVNRVQLKLTRGVREVISTIIEQVLDLAGPPPCKFCIIGLGSHGRTEVAPYSDFEFALLLEKDMQDEGDEDSFVSSYFGRFVEMMDFLVNCIGEPTGFRLDTQGTPKEYRFRGTPAQIVERAFKNLDAQGIPMAFSLLQPVCIYVGGPPKPVHGPITVGLTPESFASPRGVGTQSHAQLAASTPSSIHRTNTTLGLSHSGSLPSTASQSATGSSQNVDLRKTSSNAQLRRPAANSRAPPPQLASSSSFPSSFVATQPGSSPSVAASGTAGGSFSPLSPCSGTSAQQNSATETNSASSTPSSALTPTVPHIALPPPDAPKAVSDASNTLGSEGVSPIRRPSSTSSTDFSSHEAYSLYASYQDLVISRLQHDTWKGQFLHASLARYCLADHVKMLAPGKKWCRPVDNPHEVHLKDHFLTPLICFTHDIALYYLSHIPTVFPSDASATSHLMDSLAVSNARTPNPVISSAYASSFREAWAALNAIRIRAELEYGEQIDAETPVYLDAKAAPLNGVVLTPMERYWLKFVEYVVQKPLYRVLQTFLEAMPTSTSASATGSGGSSEGRVSQGASGKTTRNSGTTAATTRNRPQRRSSIGAGSLPIPYGGLDANTTAGSSDSIVASALPGFIANASSNSTPALSSSLQTSSTFTTAMSSSLSSSTTASPVVGRNRSGSDAGQSLSASVGGHVGANVVVAHESDIETMDPAIYWVEHLLEQHRAGVMVTEWREPVVSLAWTLTLRHSAPRVHLTYYRLFPLEWRRVYYLTLEQLEHVHGALLENVFDEICSYADPAGSRLHSKPMDSLWREQVNAEVSDRLEPALLVSLEANPNVKAQKVRSTSTTCAPSPSATSAGAAPSQMMAPATIAPPAAPVPTKAAPSPPGVTVTPLSPLISHQWLPSKANSSQAIVVVASPSPEPDPAARAASPFSPYQTPSKILVLPELIPMWNNRKLEPIQPKRLDGRVVESDNMIFYFPANLLSSVSEVVASLFYRRIVFRGSAQVGIARIPIRRYIREQLEKATATPSNGTPRTETVSSMPDSPSRDLENSIGMARKRNTPETGDVSSPASESRKATSDKKKLVTAALAVQRMTGESLKTVFERNPEALLKLDRQSFSDSFLAALLLVGSERFADEVLLQPYLHIDKENVQSEAFRLVVCRHEGAWGECAQMTSPEDPSSVQGAASKLLKPVRNIIFCLDMMNEPVNPDSLFQFLDLDPVAVVTSWIKELKQAQQRWTIRFGATDAKRLFQPPTLQSIGSNSSDLLGVQEHVVPRLVSLMTKIQTALRGNPKKSHLEILKTIHPVLGHLYGKAHRNLSLKTPLERFEEISKPVLVSSIYRLMPRSSDIQIFAQPSKMTLLSASELRVQLGTYIKESAMLADTKNLVMDSFNQGRWELFHFNPHLQQRVLEALDSKELPPAVQSALFALVEQSNQRLTEITIRNSDALDNAMLESLVRQCGQMITKLHLPGCQKMENRFIGGSDVIKLLADHCPGLTSLDLSGTNIKYFAVQQLTRTAEIKFERLEWLFLDHCRQLEKVKLYTPALWHVDARHCSELVKLEANTKNATWATADLFGSKIVCSKLLMLVGLSLSKPISYLSMNSRRFQDLLEPLEALLTDSSKTRYEASHRTIPHDLIVVLATILSHSSLAEITFNSCEIEDDSVRILADACLLSRKCTSLVVPTIHSSTLASGSSSRTSPDTIADPSQAPSTKIKLSFIHSRIPASVQQEVLGKALGTSVFISFSE
jgi:hypothetical protein